MKCDDLDWRLSDKILAMIVWLRHFLGWFRSAFCARADLILENLALRQQLLVFHAQRPRRRLTASHKLFWVVLRRMWSRWKEPLILVTPRTVVGWHLNCDKLSYRIDREHHDNALSPLAPTSTGHPEAPVTLEASVLGPLPKPTYCRTAIATHGAK